MKKDIKPIRHDASVQRYIDFTLPEYVTIPDVGLLLDQTARLVNGYLETLGDNLMTGSMISNYVKHQIIARPVKKLYYREQIASLIFIAIAKTVLSLDDITRLLEIQRAEYTPEAAYDMFCRHFEAALSNRFKTVYMHDCRTDEIRSTEAVSAALTSRDAYSSTADSDTFTSAAADKTHNKRDAEPYPVMYGNTSAASMSYEAHGSFNTYLLDSLINAVVECIHLRAIIEQAGDN